MKFADLEPERPGDLAHRAWGFRESRLLQVAVRLALFTALERAQPCEAGALASAIRGDAEMVERLLVALGALGLVMCGEEGWRNLAPASRYLVEGAPLYQGDVFRLAAEEWDRYHDLEALVRDGVDGAQRDELLERQQGSDHYLGALHALAVSGEAQRLARLLPMLAGRRTLLDVGGAPGTYAAALCQAFPLLSVTVLDHAGGEARCTALGEEAGVAERLRYRVGAWREEAWGTDEVDALRLGYLMGGSEGEAMALLVKSYEALKVDGLLIFQGFLLPADLNDAGRAGLIHVLDSLLTLDQLQSLLAEAGFERVTVLHRDGRSGDVLVAYKGREAETEDDPALAEALATPEEARLTFSEEAESGVISRQREGWQRFVKR